MSDRNGEKIRTTLTWKLHNAGSEIQSCVRMLNFITLGVSL